jgi:hypothetical protein
MCQFLKDSVNQKRFSSGWLLNGSAGTHVAAAAAMDGTDVVRVESGTYDARVA